MQLAARWAGGSQERLKTTDGALVSGVSSSGRGSVCVVRCRVVYGGVVRYSF